MHLLLKSRVFFSLFSFTFIFSFNACAPKSGSGNNTEAVSSSGQEEVIRTLIGTWKMPCTYNEGAGGYFSDTWIITEGNLNTISYRYSTNDCSGEPDQGSLEDKNYSFAEYLVNSAPVSGMPTGYEFRIVNQGDFGLFYINSSNSKLCFHPETFGSFPDLGNSNPAVWSSYEGFYSSFLTNPEVFCLNRI